jgi:hypothetical protein
MALFGMCSFWIMIKIECTLFGMCPFWSLLFLEGALFEWEQNEMGSKWNVLIG